MSSASIQAGQPTKVGQGGGFPAVVPSKILLDKLDVRRSTPDSEALASSDDEGETPRQECHLPSVQPTKPTRRSSWLNETSQPASAVRKGSFASSSMSSTTSHPTTPSAEAGVGAWGGTHGLSRNHPNPSSFPWGTGIWNNERKEPPARLSEVLPSPTSCAPPGGPNSFFSGENGISQMSPGPKEQASNSQIPFAIPLHPTPKTYRSQSYSVGQLEPDAAAALGPSVLASRSRVLGHSGLQHRPSRPSMLSEMANEGAMLGKLTEDDDDDSNGSMQSSQHQSAEAAKTIELLARENAMLRQQQYQNSRHRSRASTSSAYGLVNGHLQEAVPEESDYAIEELDESNDGADMVPKVNYGRRMSEYGVPFRTPLLVENRKLENVKKGTWQTSLGFGVSALADIPQSRRHSFADISNRHGSISSIGEVAISLEPAVQDSMHSDFPVAYPDNASYANAHQGKPTSHRDGPGYLTTSAGSAYFGVPGMPGHLPQPSYSNQYPATYASASPYQHRPPSPHRNMYGQALPRHNQTLHVVTFKCSRADVFYIQEGTGLHVKNGDLVIVEADRGTDLGTVARVNVDWQTAKDLKEHFAEEHYRWLMLFSQNVTAAQDGSGAGPLAGSNGLQASAIGGMGPPGQHHVQEPNAGELKPKLIKRVAQNHEIDGLRDKEGNEAKAKRVCQQKVKDHGLSMEILDAEFQVDWKKLTFYYFADSYINFNSLVTDLFKIYKTRIWMSAINPASFASPTLGLQAPSGIGPGAVGVNRGSSASQRRQEAQQEQQPSFMVTPTSRGVPAPYNNNSPNNNQFGADRPSPNFTTAPYSYNSYGAFENASRPNALSYGPGLMGGADVAYSSVYPGSPPARFPPPQPNSQRDQGGPPMGSPADWAGAFQGLSLNSR